MLIRLSAGETSDKEIPKNNLSILAKVIAETHIRQGSQVQKMSQPLRFLLPTTCPATPRAFISA
ncbi:MAG: hypothetical protein ABIA83_03495 [Patescibacteria group bacterium]